jgi:hypothetical protein
MSEIEDSVSSELRKESELKPLEQGFVWERGEDVSCLWLPESIYEPRPGHNDISVLSECYYVSNLMRDKAVN